MKLILYVIALASIGGAAYYSYSNIALHQDQLDLTTAEIAKVKKKRIEINKKEVELQSEEAQRADAKKENNNLIATKEIKEKEVRDFTKESASYDDELSHLKAKKKEINNTIAEIEKELEGEKVPLEGVEEFVTGLENEKKTLNKTNVDLLEDVALLTSDVKKNNGVLADFKTAQIKRRKNLNANKVSSLITKVDSDWGFVIVKKHPDSMIKQDSKLLVIRGNRHIGRLTIDAIEEDAGRIIANINYSSVAPGMRIRPGDRVIMSKPLTK